MKPAAALALIFIAIAVPSASTAGGPCEMIQNDKWEHDTWEGWEPSRAIKLKTCIMKWTLIEWIDFTITSARNESVEGFDAYQNKKLVYLPSNIGEKFPNMIAMDASECSIKKLLSGNFKHLSKLRLLDLSTNHIETINDDTFEHIPAVEIIYLWNNKIKNINGIVFTPLSKIKLVNLNDNECIDENFSYPAIIAHMPRKVTEKCGFVEQKGGPSQMCGVRKKATALIVRGESFDRGDYPWMVALYRNLYQKKQPEYICGGTIISDRHILTAAHCLEDLEVRYIAVVFGAYNLTHREPGKFVKSPSRKFVHDEWKPATAKFDADIAMLQMAEKIAFSLFVQPICLWMSDVKPAVSNGIVAGWGQSQNASRQYEVIPTRLELPIHTQETCFLDHPVLVGPSSNRTFCAGLADGRGPCYGDSGGGFYVDVENVYYLKGIVSAAHDVDSRGVCILKKYTIYTDVQKFTSWINATMRMAKYADRRNF